jgi:DNA transposition AAA+ family ATPase
MSEATSEINETEAIAAKIDRWIELYKDEGASQSSLARATGYSASVINQLRSGKYQGNAALAIGKINKYIDNYARKEEVVLWIETSQTKIAAKLVSNAIRDRKMAVIHGEAGAGKTYFIRHFIGDYPNAIYLEIVRGQTTRDVLREIAAALKIQPKRSNYRTFEEICAAIGDRFIVIDQAEFLRNETLEFIRGINDRAKAPIMLIGIEQILDLLAEHKHLYSRIKYQWRVQKLKKEEIAALLDAYGLSADLADTAGRLSRHNFRSATYLIENALDLANGEAIGAELLTDAKAMLLI